MGYWEELRGSNRRSFGEVTGKQMELGEAQGGTMQAMDGLTVDHSVPS